MGRSDAQSACECKGGVDKIDMKNERRSLVKARNKGMKGRCEEGEFTAGRRGISNSNHASDLFSTFLLLILIDLYIGSPMSSEIHS